ncbi:TBC domain-containing protein kinase protein [Fasciola gigantica]|uniref:TBC domain-containing protein kinase protein n=1 Tax=Fasciola gigantica TaxID=46835 RepID=A0A504Y755_FASGI|nr:TBC domain-containing protein kinase protein [Fasciola gigantica]
MSFELPLGLSTFRVSVSMITDVEVNGLPRLPSSVTCFARLRSLRALRHPNLCSYLDVVRRKPERLFSVSEAYGRNLSDITGPISDSQWLSVRLSECFSALHYLSKRGLVHAYLNPAYIMLNEREECKVAAYGLYYATGWGKDVDFPVADPVYSAPEVFFFSPFNQQAKISGSSCISESSAAETSNPCLLNILSDVWSIGLIFLELIRGRDVTSPLHRANKSGTFALKPFSTIRVLVEGLRCCDENNPRLSDFLHFGLLNPSAEKTIRDLEALCHNCLHFDARLRPKPELVMEQLSPMVQGLRKQNEGLILLRMSKDLSEKAVSSASSSSKAIHFLSSRCDLAEVYYYWCLAGGNLDAVWKEAEMCSKLRSGQSSTSLEHPTNNSISKNKLWSRPPVLRIPNYLSLLHNDISDVFYLTENWPSTFDDEQISFDPRIVLLPCQRLLERIQRIPLDILYPLLMPSTRSIVQTISRGKNKYFVFPNTPHGSHPSMITGQESGSQLSITHLLFTTVPLPHDLGLELFQNDRIDSMRGQPITIKEQDVEYQIRRICLFNRLLNALPATQARLQLEVRTDIPPFLRSRIWSALLGVDSDHNYRERFAEALCSTTLHTATADVSSCKSSELINPITSQMLDPIYGLLDDKAANQISVDLPRCHAYDALLASPMGQTSLRRVLVATLLMHPGTLEYTQGMDSVAAVFVRLCFPDEALAAACLNALLRTKLSIFFSSDGFTHGLRQFFDVLLRLFAFHNPSLAVNLTDLNVPLVGLTTGWIYTLFAHAMPLDRVELMWDTLIVGPPSLSLFFYLAIFLQLDQQVNFERLCSPDAWPEHLECVYTQPDTKPASVHLLWMSDNPLVSLLDAKDALEHLIRPDCVVVDVRPKADYAKGCVAGSIYCSPGSIQSLLLKRNSSSSKLEDNGSSSTTGDWELIDHPGGIRRQSRVLPAFLVNLMSDEVWKQAVNARREASRRQYAQLGSAVPISQSSVYAGNCPGLTIIVGGSDTCPTNQQIHSTVAMQFANWLIREDVDRVCVLKGGLAALLALPAGADLLTCPAPYTGNNY